MERLFFITKVTILINATAFKNQASFMPYPARRVTPISRPATEKD
jgi:hypothetical protein